MAILIYELQLVLLVLLATAKAQENESKKL